MAEPPSKESEIPSPPTSFTPPTIPKSLRHCFAQSPDDDEMWCSSDGEHAWRLAQARQNSSITHRDAHAQKPHRLRDLYTTLPKPLRVLHAKVIYETSFRDTEPRRANTNWMASKIVVATDEKYLPRSPNQRLLEHSERTIFDCQLRMNANDARFMASVITNICERIPVALSEIDSTLAEFIITTAERHAGATSHKLPTVKLCPPSHDLPARVESTISVIYRHSMPNATSLVNQATPGSLQMESCSLSLPLSQLPHHEPAPEIPSAFSLPTPTQDTMQHPIQIMHWIQSHVHGKAFGAEKDFNRYVRHLIQVSCPARQPRYQHAIVDNEEKEEEDDDDYENCNDYSYRDKLFAIRLSPRRDTYRIKPRTLVQEDFCGALPVIILPASRESLRRVLERLETVFLTTGRLEAGWEAACCRADVELGMEENETLKDAICVCLFEDRPNTVHRCHDCFSRLLCASRYLHARDDSIFTPLCLGCRARATVLSLRYPSSGLDSTKGSTTGGNAGLGGKLCCCLE